MYNAIIDLFTEIRNQNDAGSNRIRMYICTIVLVHSADMNNDKVLKTFSAYLSAKLNQFSFSEETKLVGFFYIWFLDMDPIFKGLYSRWQQLII